MPYKIVYLCADCDALVRTGRSVRACQRCTIDPDTYKTIEDAARARSVSGDLVVDADSMELVDSKEWWFKWEIDDVRLNTNQCEAYVAMMCRLHRASKRQTASRQCCRCG